MSEFFSSLARAVASTPAAALGASFLWGILSVVLSPCHLASIPLVVGFVNGQGRMSGRRALWLSTLFAAGVLATIALVGVVTAATGRMVGDTGRVGNYFVVGIFLLVGLYLLGVLPASWNAPARMAARGRGPAAALVLGLVFGLALGPCTFAFMAPLLAVAFRAGATSLLYGAALLAAYGVGHSSVIIGAGTSTQAVQRYLDWNQASRGATMVRRVCGVLVLLAGLYMLYSAP